MQEKIPHRRYCMQDYGGQKFIEMLRNISIYVMYVKGLANPTEGMRFPYDNK